VFIIKPGLRTYLIGLPGSFKSPKKEKINLSSLYNFRGSHISTEFEDATLIDCVILPTYRHCRVGIMVLMVVGNETVHICGPENGVLCILTYLLVYLLTYIHTYLLTRTYLFTFLLTYLFTYLLIYLFAYLLTYLRVLTYLLHAAESLRR